MLNRIINEPITTKIIEKIPFKEKDLSSSNWENIPMKIGVVIVKVAIRYAGKYW